MILFQHIFTHILRCQSGSVQINSFFAAVYDPKILVFVRSITLKFEFKFEVYTCCRKVKADIINVAFVKCVYRFVSFAPIVSLYSHIKRTEIYCGMFFLQTEKLRIFNELLERDSACACECGNRLAGIHIRCYVMDVSTIVA